MPLYLVPRTSPSCAIGICGRCRVKMYLSELKSDPNIPGMRVCKECADNYDPYRLAARAPDSLDVSNPRPDEKLDG